MGFPKPVLYVTNAEPLGTACQQAIKLLDDVGCDYNLKRVAVYDGVSVMHGLPCLFGLSVSFEGVGGVQRFIENATFLHSLPVRATPSESAAT